MRIRTTRPEYYASPTVGEMSWDARLVFHHLWSYVEDNGVNYDSSKLIKSMCMPYDGDQVVSRIEDALDELEKLDCVIRYERDGHRLLFLPGFRKWQKVPHPGACHFLPPSGYDRQGYQVSHEDSCDSRESLTTSTESLTTSRAFSSSRSSSNKKEEENKFSSSKEKTTLTAFQSNRSLAHANAEIIKAYPDLDLPDSWNAFTARHHGETRTVTDWFRQWKGWCERRARMSGIPPSKPHRHSWQCDHVLAALHRTLETAQPDQQACQLANQLNKKGNNHGDERQ